jgi:exodeoxyribonuclease-3
MKIATFNINGVNGRLPLLLEWLEEARPDAVALQELKCADRSFPAKALAQAGYGAIWHGQKSWHGVAILARGSEPVETARGLAGDGEDGESRYIEAAVKGVIVTSLYAPNGNPQPGPRFDYKLAWMERLEARTRELWESGLPVVLAGDFNVVPTDADIYPTSSYSENALVQPESRAAFHAVVKQGWTDAIRARYPSETVYTFWDYKRGRWSRDAGLRLDHLLLSADLADRLEDAGVDKAGRGREGASDHAPTWITLR